MLSAAVEEEKKEEEVVEMEECEERREVSSRGEEVERAVVVEVAVAVAMGRLTETVAEVSLVSVVKSTPRTRGSCNNSTRIKETFTLSLLLLIIVNGLQRCNITAERFNANASVHVVL
jgi:hypothetical protein